MTMYMRSCNGWEKKEGAMNCRKEKRLYNSEKKMNFLILATSFLFVLSLSLTHSRYLGVSFGPHIIVERAVQYIV